VIYPDRDQEDPRFDWTVEAYDFPYAWRGITDTSRPHIRPDKDGGCHR
jgi:hypothetical protein